MTNQEIVPETPDVVIGNHTRKYTAKNPAIRWLTARWVDQLESMLDRVAAEQDVIAGRALEVGCGEGVIAARLTHRWKEVTALDLPDAGLRAEWRSRPGPSYLHADAHRLPFADDQFDVVVAAEVLEHLPDPVRGLRELARVGCSHLVLSVPREPIFRGCNLVAGRYVKDLGNTPGHLNHWSKRSFVRFVSEVAEVRAVAARSRGRSSGRLLARIGRGSLRGGAAALPNRDALWCTTGVAASVPWPACIARPELEEPAWNVVRPPCSPPWSWARSRSAPAKTTLQALHFLATAERAVVAQHQPHRCHRCRLIRPAHHSQVTATSLDRRDTAGSVCG